MSKEIKLNGLKNFRGLGGIETEEGYLIKPNTIFRSSAITGLDIGNITILENLGIKTIVDFRSKSEVEENPDDIIEGAVYHNITPNAEVAQEASRDAVDSIPNDLLKYLDEPENLLIDEMRRLVSDKRSNSVYKEFLHMFKSKNNLPIVFHCRGGKDRAGFAAMLILMTLGVSKDNIIKDYLITEEVNVEINKKKMVLYAEKYDDLRVLAIREALMSAKKSYIDAAFDEVGKVSGSKENYLKEVMELTSNDIELIRENCLLDYKKK